MAEASLHQESPSAWRGTSLLVTDAGGECGAEEPFTGFFVRETRHLRVLRLRVNGKAPWMCEWTQAAADRLAFVLIHPELTSFGGGGSGASGDETTRDEDGLPHRSLDIRLVYRVELDRLAATVEIGNRSRFPLAFSVAWEFAADYADLLEANERRREQEAEVRASVEDGVAVLRYAHERLPFVTRVGGEPAAEVSADCVRWEVQLEPQQSRTLRLVVDALDPDRPLTSVERQTRQGAQDRWRDGLVLIRTPGNPELQRILDQSRADLATLPLLEGESDEWLGLQAGLPLYPAFFGRDALTAGWQAALLDQGTLLDAALTRLGRLQSSRVAHWTDEEPGRIPYQVRTGPLARLGRNPYGGSYADFASPLMYVISLANLYAWSGDRAQLDRHWRTACRLLDWARLYGDRDGDGYLEYETRSPMGARNQGWKDSGDAIVHEDGRPVAPPIATCELQGYWYAAQTLMAGLAWVRGERRFARELWRSARALKRRFGRDFWMEDEGFHALALDREKKPVRAITSNVGHCLASGIVDRKRLPRVVERLFAPDLFSGWGVRTLSTGHAVYNPLSYHLGSVWAVENATICFGLRRFGFDAEAVRLAGAMVELAALYSRGRIPETVGGYARDEHPTPGAYPRSNTLQTWNASSLFLCLQALLGLLPWGARHLLVVDPVLPDWLPAVELAGLRVGRTRATLRFWRSRGGSTRFEVLRKDGPLLVVRQPPPEALGVGIARRVAALIT